MHKYWTIYEERLVWRVFRIYDILVWIRIRGSMPLTNGSGFGSGSGSIPLTNGIRTREAQKHVDPVDPDPDPEHCLWVYPILSEFPYMWGKFLYILFISAVHSQLRGRCIARSVWWCRSSWRSSVRGARATCTCWWWRQCSPPPSHPVPGLSAKQLSLQYQLYHGVSDENKALCFFPYTIPPISVQPSALLCRFYCFLSLFTNIQRFPVETSLELITKKNEIKMISAQQTESYYSCVYLYNIYVSIPIFMYRLD